MTPSDARRFEAKVAKSGPLVPGMRTRCWRWTGAVGAAGYPRFWLGGNAVTAQRAARLLAGAKLRPDQRVISLCRNRGCVRPEHLVVCTVREAHAFALRGQRALGPGDLWHIRRVVAKGEVTIEFVANAYGLGVGVVRQVVAGG